MYKSRIGSCFLGRTLELETSDIALAVTLDVGPRIISLKKPNGSNIMFEDIDDAINKDCSAIYGKGKRWHIYGGHRIWLSPEDESTYYPDNFSVEYRLTDNGAIFTPPAWLEAGVQPILEVRFTDGGADIVMGLTNITKLPKELCLWGLTVLKCGGVLEADLPNTKTGYLPNRNFVLWDYTDIKDERLTLHNDKLIVKSSVSATQPFKIGYYNPNINLKYTFGDTIFTKTARTAIGMHTDFFCNVETYTSNLIHEVETLSPIVKVNSKDTLWHIESWRIS